MLLRISVSVLSLVLVALALGAAFAHVLELPNKMRLSAETWLIVQSRLYDGWGNVLGPVEVSGLLVCFVLAAMQRALRIAFVSALMAGSGVAAALVVWVVFVLPSNIAVENMVGAGPAENWQSIRDQWEYGHAARAAVLLVSFIALAVSIALPASTTRVDLRLRKGNP